MRSLWKILVNLNFKRCLCTTTGNFSKYRFREGRFMNKMLNSERGKRKWYTNKDHPTSLLSTEKIMSNHVQRRINVLSNLYMQYITDLMAMGDMSLELVGRKIEVTHVQVTSDFRHVLVFWYSNIKEQQSETEQILIDYGYKLRHELTQLNVLGQVPLIKFVKNKELVELEKLEETFKVADYGEDHQPLVQNVAEKNELMLVTKLPPEVREKILELEDEEEEEDEENMDDLEMFKVDLPPMRHDVLSVDHSAIMSRVRASLKKSHDGATNRLTNIISFDATGTCPSVDSSALQNIKTNNEAFTNFLLKRRIENRRKARQEKRDNILHHLGSRNIDVVDDDDDNDFDDQDTFPYEDEPEDITLDSIK